MTGGAEAHITITSQSHIIDSIQKRFPMVKLEQNAFYNYY